MIWYAFEILIALSLLFLAFLFYRFLVNSPAFTRFIERTKGTDETDIDDAAVRLDVAEERADLTAVEIESHVKRQAAALERLKRRRGS